MALQRMQKGSSGHGEVMMLPAGHDAWPVGDQGCAFVELSRSNGYYDT